MTKKVAAMLYIVVLSILGDIAYMYTSGTVSAIILLILLVVMFMIYLRAV